MKGLEGKRAVVCGSTQGIGKAAAMRLAEEGVEVILLSRNEDKLAQVCTQLPAKHGQHHRYVVADQQNPDQVAAALQEAINPSQPIHILINNTGGPAARPASEADLNAYAAAFTMHVLSGQAMVKALIPLMKAKSTTRKRKGNRPGPVSKWDKVITGILKEKDTPMTYEQLTDALMTHENRDLSQRKNTKATVTNTVFRLRKDDRLNTFSKGGRVKYVALMNWFDGDGSINENYLDKAQTTTRKNKKVVPAKKKATTAAKAPAATAAPAAKATATKAPSAKASAKRKPAAKKAAAKKPAAKKRTTRAAKK